VAQVTRRRSSIRGPVVFLCEGTHDAAFLSALLRTRGIATDPELPFFRQSDRGFEQFPEEAYGDGAFAAMLRNVASDLDVDPLVTERLRGIVMVCDSGDHPTRTLTRCKKAAKSAGFIAPATHGVWSGAAAGRPSVVILLIPAAGRPGGLETLCRDYLDAAHPKVAQCVTEFLSCIPPLQPPRTREKHDKAALACAVAALQRDEPALTLTRAFTGGRPLVDVLHETFTPFADALAALLALVPMGGAHP